MAKREISIVIRAAKLASKTRIAADAAEAALGAAKQKLILNTAREIGLLDEQPVEVFVQGLDRLRQAARVTVDPTESAAVSVRIGANSSAERKAMLKGAGLAWNGRSDLWRGQVGADALARLKGEFGDRVETVDRTDGTPIAPANAAGQTPSQGALPDVADALPAARGDRPRRRPRTRRSCRRRWASSRAPLLPNPGRSCRGRGPGRGLDYAIFAAVSGDVSRDRAGQHRICVGRGLSGGARRKCRGVPPSPPVG